MVRYALPVWVLSMGLAWGQEGPVEVPPPPGEVARSAQQQIQEALREAGLRNAPVYGMTVETQWRWAAIAQRGVKIETAEQATRVLEAGLAEWETRLVRGNRAGLAEVTEALHELRWSVEAHRWKFEWVELTWQTKLDALRERQGIGREGAVAEQLARLRWVGNELPAWILDKTVETATQRVFERGGEAARQAFAKVHPGLVPNAVYYPQGEMFGEAAARELTLSQSFVNEVYVESRKLPKAQRALFQSQVFAFMAARTAVHLEGGTGDVDRLVREATGAEVLPEAKRMGTRATVELDRAGTISRDGRRVLPENPIKKAERLAWERGVNNALSELYAVENRQARARLNWQRVRGMSAEFGSGYGKFLLAIFLKELTAGLAEGDTGRIRELFSQMGTLGLFQEYGLFMAGAAAGEVAYNRFLERHVAKRSQQLSRVVRSNLALATGLALPRLVRGEGLDRTYAVSLASLGLSAAAVEGVMSRIPGVRRLQAARSVAGARRALRVGGWVYQGVELALVLTVGEQLEHYWLERLQAGDLRDALEASAAQLLEADDDGLAAAVEDYQTRWDDWRTFLLKPAAEAQGRFEERLARLARQAKLDDDKAGKARELAEKFPGLPLEEFAGRLGTDESTADDFAAAGQRYAEELDAELGEAYEAGRRDGPFLPGHVDAGDFARAHRDPSQNRLQTYEDQADALNHALRLRGRREALLEALGQVEAMQHLDSGLLGAGALRGSPPQGAGAADTLREALSDE